MIGATANMPTINGKGIDRECAERDIEDGKRKDGEKTEEIDERHREEKERGGQKNVLGLLASRGGN